jgi:hypothetical protein
VIDLVVRMRTCGEAVAKQDFIAAIGRHRTAMVLGAVAGRLSAVAIDPERSFG